MLKRIEQGRHQHLMTAHGNERDDHDAVQQLPKQGNTRPQSRVKDIGDLHSTHLTDDLSRRLRTCEDKVYPKTEK